MNWVDRTIALSLDKPRFVYWVMGILTLVTGLAISQITVDTDPENMLSKDEPARVFHNQVKKEFQLHDIIVVGAVVRDKEDIFNAQSLADLKKLTDYILTIDGVVKKDVNSLSTIDNIEQAGPGTIRFEWMMPSAPKTDEEAKAIGEKAKRLPFVMDSLVSNDGKAATIYVPIVDKNESYRISQQIRDFLSQLSTINEYHITGLPVAEDTFGVEMFVQMAISAPLAALVIYLLMLYFFKSPSLVTAPMIIAMATVIITMGTMIGLGYTVHIMSSMIPIFLMPIAVVDSVHIMSEFADRYTPEQRCCDVIKHVVKQLFKPMLFTSVTSAVGFFSLALTPIPPVQVFGIFVGMGILLAFVLTITFIPAYVGRMSKNKLHKMREKLSQSGGSHGALAKWLPKVGIFTTKYSVSVIVLFIGIGVFAWYGIHKIEVNDNPVRWFRAHHEIRIADEVLNRHFAGTYDAHLVFSAEDNADELEDWQTKAIEAIESSALNEQTKTQLLERVSEVKDFNQLASVAETFDTLLFDAKEQDIDLLESLLAGAEELMQKGKVFSKPEVLAYIEGLQAHLKQSGLVGKSNAVTDLIKTVNRELRSGNDKDYRLPKTQNGVAQALLQFQSSHRPQDLWHFLTPDYRKTLVWLQLTSGDNKDMSAVVDAVNEYLKSNPLPDGVRMDWAGKTYINLIWQDKMVTGMFESLTSSFVVVLLMMVFLFRSATFGLLAMLPLSVTIAFMYGVIGWIGKYYDMPIAVLSALTLGLSVDFAIHFLQRTREEYARLGNWPDTIKTMFEEPARAISRNALVIALGFTPLLVAPLVPYVTVGAFLASIMAVSAVVTLILLPSSMTIMRGWLFKKEN